MKLDCQHSFSCVPTGHYIRAYVVRIIREVACGRIPRYVLWVHLLFLNPSLWVISRYFRAYNVSAAPHHAMHAPLHEACLFLDATRAGVLGAPLVPKLQMVLNE